jgi:hypothetical protein
MTEGIALRVLCGALYSLRKIDPLVNEKFP